MVCQGQSDIVSQIQLAGHPCLHLLPCLRLACEGGYCPTQRWAETPQEARDVTLQRPAPSTRF